MQTPAELQQYDDWVRSHPKGTLWQSLAWKQYQEALNKEVRIYAEKEGKRFISSALVVIDRTSFGLSTWEIPRGPLYEELVVRGQRSEELLEIIKDDAKADKCYALYLSPSQKLTTDHYALAPSNRHQHPEATRIIDLTLSEEEILAQMKPKGRYNIRVAEKNGVQISESNDLDSFFALIEETAKRDRFRHPSKAHYHAFLEHLPGAFLLIATSPQSSALSTAKGPIPISGLLGVIWGSQAIYYYGASSYAHRAKMAPYLLQWEAMRLCKTKGCSTYDLLGVAPPNAPRTHPWYGITEFKEKFGGSVVTYPPEQQSILRPGMWRLLQWKRAMWR
jgi:lipid II:glycine glycyltransferase (peptidoglycan interpeptide bridge formation enzyme)